MGFVFNIAFCVALCIAGTAATFDFCNISFDDTVDMNECFTQVETYTKTEYENIRSSLSCVDQSSEYYSKVTEYESRVENIFNEYQSYYSECYSSFQSEYERIQASDICEEEKREQLRSYLLQYNDKLYNYISELDTILNETSSFTTTTTTTTETSSRSLTSSGRSPFTFCGLDFDETIDYNDVFPKLNSYTQSEYEKVLDILNSLDEASEYYSQKSQLISELEDNYNIYQQYYNECYNSFESEYNKIQALKDLAEAERLSQIYDLLTSYNDQLFTYVSPLNTLYSQISSFSSSTTTSSTSSSYSEKSSTSSSTNSFTRSPFTFCGLDFDETIDYNDVFPKLNSYTQSEYEKVLDILNSLDEASEYYSQKSQLISELEDNYNIYQQYYNQCYNSFESDYNKIQALKDLAEAERLSQIYDLLTSYNDQLFTYVSPLNTLYSQISSFSSSTTTRSTSSSNSKTSSTSSSTTKSIVSGSPFQFCGIDFDETVDLLDVFSQLDSYTKTDYENYLEFLNNLAEDSEYYSQRDQILSQLEEEYSIYKQYYEQYYNDFCSKYEEILALEDLEDAQRSAQLLEYLLSCNDQLNSYVSSLTSFCNQSSSYSSSSSSSYSSSSSSRSVVSGAGGVYESTNEVVQESSSNTYESCSTDAVLNL